jgi:hypothetical protein
MVKREAGWFLRWTWRARISILIHMALDCRYFCVIYSDVQKSVVYALMFVCVYVCKLWKDHIHSYMCTCILYLVIWQSRWVACMWMYIFLPACLFYLSICLSFCLCIPLSVFLSFYLSICLSVCLSVCLSGLSVYLSVCLSDYANILWHTYARVRIAWFL